MSKTVAIGGLGAIGLPLARALDGGIEGLTLIAVAARDRAKAEANLKQLRQPPRFVELEALADPEHANFVAAVLRAEVRFWAAALA